MNTAKKCLNFIDKSVTCFHAIENLEKQWQEKGFVELKEQEKWKIKKGESYYVKRNGSSAIAFKVPLKEAEGFHIMAAHSDSPSFKVKAEPETCVENHYVKLNVEPYGGMIYATWLDRCLSAAGRIIYKDGKELKEKTVNVDEDLLVIPNVAIHMDRDMNKNLSYNLQTDLQPLICSDVTEEDKGESILMDRVASYANVPKESILGKDLFLYVREKGKLAGFHNDLMISPRLDDLECVFALQEGFLLSSPEEYIAVCAVFDNEEVGSRTRQGADSGFLKDTLMRVGEALGKPGDDYLRLLAGSFMISADNAHALHPNHPEKADSANKPYLNGGIVIKYHGGQKYATDAYSEAVMKDICKEADVPWQVYCNRSDIPGGSTLGNILAGRIAVPCVDIGLPQLAMHSAVECAGSRDVEYLIRASEVFFNR